MVSIFDSTFTPGQVETYAAGMYSQKTTMLEARTNKLKHSHPVKEGGIIAFKPASDTRPQQVRDITGTIDFIAIPDKDPMRMIDYLKGHKLSILDEAQFFRNGLVKAVQYMRSIDMMVLVAGLDRTFTGETYNEMGDLLVISDYRPNLTGICAVDGKPSTHTQRLMLGRPAPADSPTNIVQDSSLAKLLAVTYEPRCASCHEVYEAPTFAEVMNELVGRLDVGDKLEQIAEEISRQNAERDRALKNPKP
ncbi:MAG: hypothetical protein ABIA93_04350 [Candidatus Woesearchaeota archaeon]